MSKWEGKDGLYKTLNHPKMLHEVDQKHPRIISDGKPMLIPLSTNVGNLMQMPEEEMTATEFDHLGIGTSVYFKLLKSFVVLMFLCTIVALPLAILYSSGSYASLS